MTRETLLTLAADAGYDVGEGSTTLDQWRDDCAAGHISEMFACGTAAAITPIGAVRTHTHSWNVGAGTTGPVTTTLRQTLLDIQTGRGVDTHGWNHPV